MFKIFVRRKLHDEEVGRFRRRAEEARKEVAAYSEQTVKAKGEVTTLKRAIQALTDENIQLQKKNKTKVYERDLKEYMSPIPVKEEERRAYMAQVAGIYEGGLKDKLNHLHLEFRNQTGMFPLTERETDFFRSCINVVGLLLDWGEESVNEQHAYVAQANDKAEANAFGDDDEAVKNIKNVIK